MKIDGNRISVEGVLPEGVKGGQQVAVSADVATGGNPGTTAMQMAPQTVTLTGIATPSCTSRH